MTNSNYLKNFFAEKVIPYQDWTITANNGVSHFIDNDVVIEFIMKTIGSEQEQICTILRKIDFANGNVNHFLKFLAEGLVNKY